MRQTPTLQAVNVRMSLNPEVVGSIAIVRFWLQGDIQPPEIDVCSTPESRRSHGHH